MRKLSILTFITLGLFISVSAQVDIVNARANPKTFIFDDEKHTVHGYIYNTLKEKTSCCGNDAIYLEVKFDQTGAVTSAKTLTGKSDCYKKSIVDIVQKVKWDATGVSGSKTIYFEVKPIIPCSGSPGENVYKPVGDGGGVVASVEPKGSDQSGNGGNLTDKADTEEKTVVVEKEEPKKEVVAVEEPKKEEESFLSDDEPKKEEPKKEVVAVKETVKEEPKKETMKEPSPKESVKVVKVVEPVKPAPVAAAKPKPGSPIKLPPQEKIQYVSRGDAKPDASHQGTHVNVEVPGTSTVKYSDESTFGVNLRTALRNSGYCGLAQALVELETDPNTGRVINSRVMQVNDPKIAQLVPSVIKDLKFNPTRSVANRYIYTEFKTEIVCEGQKPKYDLDQVGDFLSKPEANNGN